jgi:hypothetical protein
MKAHFIKKGWIYVPVTAAGWLVALIWFSVSAYTLVEIDIRYNSLVSSLIRFFPYFISYSVIYFWIASNTSKGAE